MAEDQAVLPRTTGFFQAERMQMGHYHLPDHFGAYGTRHDIPDREQLPIFQQYLKAV